MEQHKGERCGIDNCRSRKYHLEDGQWTCSNGHVQEGRLDIREEDEYQPRKGDRRVVERDEAQASEDKVFTGREGLALFLQAYQLILRKQVAWLIQERGFPAQFQLLVRDLWTLRLEAIYADRSSSRTGSSSGYASQTSQSGRESETEAGSRGSPMSISQSEHSDSRSRSRSRSRSTSRSSRSQHRQLRALTKTTPRLLDSIGILYLAAMMLHLPLDIVTVHRWITGQDIIYFRAITHVPDEMLARMETRWKRKFEPKVLPTAEVLRREIYHLMRYYHRRFDVVVPGVNAECFLAGYMLDLGCPPEVYPAVFKIAKKIELPLQYPVAAAQLHLLDCPDVQLMALLVIALKLCYGLDGVTRTAKTQWEIANMTPNWDAWKEIIEMKESDVQATNADEGPKRDRNWPLGIRENEIYEFTGREMDEYLDWFERNWASDQAGRPTVAIAKLFEDGDGDNGPPTREQASGEELRQELLAKRIEAFKKMQGFARIGVSSAEKSTKQIRAERNVVRPGERYPRYLKWEDVSSEKLKTIYTAAAKRIAVDVVGFAFVVQRLERRLMLATGGKGRFKMDLIGGSLGDSVLDIGTDEGDADEDGDFIFR